MKDKDLFETKAQGYKVENGKLVYFSNILDGYKHEYKDLQEICEEMNGLLKKFDSYEEQLTFWKGKAEEKLPENSVVLSREELRKLRKDYAQSERANVLSEIADGGISCHWCIEQHEKKTAEKLLNDLWHSKLETTITIQHHSSKEDMENVGKAIISTIRNKIQELAKQFGVEIKE